MTKKMAKFFGGQKHLQTERTHGHLWFEIVNMQKTREATDLAEELGWEGPLYTKRDTYYLQQSLECIHDGERVDVYVHESLCNLYGVAQHGEMEERDDD